MELSSDHLVNPPQTSETVAKALENMMSFARSKMDDPSRADDMRIFKDAESAMRALKRGCVMHTDNLRKLALETNDGVLRGPALGAADEIDRLRAEIERLTKERDEARALEAAAYKAAANYLQSAADDWRSTNNELVARKIEDEIPGVLS